MKIIGTARELLYITNTIMEHECPGIFMHPPIYMPADQIDHMPTGRIGTVRGMPIELEEVNEKRKEMTSYEFEVAAKNAVIKCIKEHHGERYTIEDINMVWFAHVLGNKKAILIDNGKNDRLYEVTYNATKDELYVDEYSKLNNTVFPSCCKSDR